MRRLALVLFMAATACGDDGGNNNRMDAGNGSDDAKVFEDAPSSNDPVTITVSLGGIAQAGIRVHFQNPDSSLIASADTDSNGVASAMMPNGGYVTAINPFNGSPGGPAAELWTYAGVQPGDELQLSDRGGGAGSSVDFLLATDNDGAVTEYGVTSPCDFSNGQSTTVTLYLDERCTPTTDVLATSLDASSEIVHWALATDVDTSGASVDLTGTALAGTPTTKMYSLTNLPGNATGPIIGVELYTPKGRVHESRVSLASTSFKLPAFANAFELFHGEIAQDFGGQVVGNWGTLATTALTVDLAPRLLKEATSAVTWSFANRQAEWTEAATGQTPEFAQGDMEFFGDLGYVSWQIVAPYAGGEIQFPTLPVETVDYNPDSEDNVGVDVTVGRVSTGWSSYRERFFSLEGPQDVATAAGGTGTLEFQLIFEDGGGGLLAPMKKALRPQRRTTGLASWKR